MLGGAPNASSPRRTITTAEACHARLISTSGSTGAGAAAQREGGAQAQRARRARRLHPHADASQRASQRRLHLTRESESGRLPPNLR